MKFYSKEETIKRHREMWNWIADHVEIAMAVCKISDTLAYLKNVAISVLHPEDVNKIRDNCYLCNYAANQRDISRVLVERCHFCPLGNFECCHTGDCLHGLYEKTQTKYNLLEFGDGRNEFVKLAREIANLPERNFSGD